MKTPKKNNKQKLFEMMAKLDSSFKPTLNETGEWVGDEDDLAWMEMLKSEVQRIQNATDGKLELIDVKGFDKYQGPYAIVNIQDSKYKIWTIGGDENNLLWIDDFIVDNTSKEGMRPGYMGTIDEIIEMLNNKLNEDVHRDDDPTSRAFRDFAKAADPKYKKGDDEKEREKPKAMNQFKRDLNEGRGSDITVIQDKNKNRVVLYWNTDNAKEFYKNNYSKYGWPFPPIESEDGRWLVAYKGSDDELISKIENFLNKKVRLSYELVVRN